MPTLRDDIIEARDRADVERKRLSKKLAQNQTWTRDDMIESIDGLDSLYEMAVEVLPYIPNNAYGGTNMGLQASGAVAPITPAPVRELYVLEYDRKGQWMPNNKNYNLLQYMFPVYPGLPGNYDDKKPGILLDGGRNTFNMNGVDWTGDNAGTDERYFDLDINIEIDAGQKGEYKIWTASGGDGNRVITGGYEGAQVCKLNGFGTQESIYSTFRLKLSDAPRGGESDFFRIWMNPSINNPDSMNGFYIHSVRCSFVLPMTYQNDYRVCHVHSVSNGKLVSTDLDSISQVNEESSFLYFRNDKHENVLMQKVHDTAGFYFQRADNKDTTHQYQVTLETGGVLNVAADSFDLSGGRFYVKRGGHIEGWVNADYVKSVKIVR